MMGGDIQVKSQAGEGSTFSMQLVFECSDDEVALMEEDSVAEEVPPGLRILVAEDNLINQQVIQAILDQFYCEVTVVENGEEAVALVQERDFDLVFMDCQMPIMDGYEASQAIRQLPETSSLPIVALTAHALDGEKEKCLSHGMTDYLAKPVTSESVARLLCRLCPSARA
jgi:CheY-like chemotaxis protein